MELWSWFGTMELVWNYGVGMELWKWFGIMELVWNNGASWFGIMELVCLDDGLVMKFFR